MAVLRIARGGRTVGDIIAVALAAGLELVPAWRHRQCDTGRRTCYECAASSRSLALARGCSRDEWRAQLAAERADADCRSGEAAAVLRAQGERLARLDELAVSA